MTARLAPVASTLALLLALAAGRAAAQTAAPVADPVRAPGFSLLDRMDGNSRAGLDMAYLFPDGDAEGTVLRFDLHAHYISQASRLGGYLQVPFAVITSDGDDLTGIGNLEVGGVYLPRVSDTFGVVLRAGITLPTGDDDEDGLANVIAGLVRPGDIYNALPEGTSLRFGASPIVRSGNLFARLDFGLDVNLDNASEESFDPAVRVGLGGGVELGAVAAIAELSSVTILADDADLGEQTINLAAIGLRATRGRVRPYGSLVIPLDDDSSEVIDAALMIGLDAALD